MIEQSGILNEKEIFIPQFCVLEVLEKCLLKCKMCGNWKCGDNPNELNIDEWKRFITGLHDKFGSKVELNFTGGEPLMKEGILELVSFAAQLGFKVIMVSNGYLIDEDKARRIADSGLNYLGISLDSLSEDIHDFMRGVPGTHNRAMKAIDYLDKFKKDDLCVGIQTIIMKKNLEEIVALVKWVQQDKRLGSVYFQAIVQPNFSSSNEEWFTDNEWYKRSEFNFLWPEDTKEVCSVIDELIGFKKEGFKIANPLGQLEAFKVYFSDPQQFNKKVRCNKGRHIFSVSPTGEIYLCHLYGSLGNVKNDDINMREIWHSREADDIRSKMNNCSKYCGPLVNCYYEE
jgi:MoaA/NifB/PqqE/SkfB family radical SAM enzyme